MPGARVSGLAIAEGIAGFILFWSGLKNLTLKQTITGLAKGTVPQETTKETPPSLGLSSGTGSAGSPGTGSGGGSTAPSAPVNLSGNETLGKALAAAHGWTGAQWNALYDLWTRESGWSNIADNPSSGAYGIAQALGHGTNGAPYPSSYGSANPPSYGGSSSASAQIAWGLSYIESTYGSPEAAWAHEESQGWY